VKIRGDGGSISAGAAAPLFVTVLYSDGFLETTTLRFVRPVGNIDDLDKVTQSRAQIYAPDKPDKVGAQVKLPSTALEGEGKVCNVCGGGESLDNDLILLCDAIQCTNAYHLSCLKPCLDAEPVGLWRCPSCKEANAPYDPKQEANEAAKEADRRDRAAAEAASCREWSDLVERSRATPHKVVWAKVASWCPWPAMISTSQDRDGEIKVEFFKHGIAAGGGAQFAYISCADRIEDFLDDSQAHLEGRCCRGKSVCTHQACAWRRDVHKAAEFQRERASEAAKMATLLQRRANLLQRKATFFGGAGESAK